MNAYVYNLANKDTNTDASTCTSRRREYNTVVNIYKGEEGEFEAAEPSYFWTGSDKSRCRGRRRSEARRYGRGGRVWWGGRRMAAYSSTCELCMDVRCKPGSVRLGVVG